MILNFKDRKGTAIIDSNSFTYDMTAAGFPNLISLKKLFDKSLNYLDGNSSLKLTMKLEYCYPDAINQQVNEEVPKHRLTFSQEYNDPSLADFTLKSSDDKTFDVHRLVLARSSDYFKALFNADMQEKQTSSVTFPDINSRVLDEVIKFIYKGTASISDTNEALSVLYAAEKLGIDGLKKICTKTLESKVNEKNVIEIFVVADLNNAKELEEKCLDIIVEKFHTLKESEQWGMIDKRLLMKITETLLISSNIELHNVL